jgi:hypothetical protein
MTTTAMSSNLVTVNGPANFREQCHQSRGGGAVVPGKKSPGPSVKKPKTYEALRDKGMSKERSAKIANAQANKSKSGKKS